MIYDPTYNPTYGTTLKVPTCRDGLHMSVGGILQCNSQKKKLFELVL